jgi:hypothetical protein
MPSQLIEKIDAWWAEFAARAKDLRDLFARRTDWDLEGWMHERLQCINKHLMWEFAPAVQTRGLRLVITPEHRRHLRPLVNTILSRAPKLRGWEFYGYRLPEDYQMTKDTVECRTGGDVSKTFFRAEINEYNMLDLLFVSPAYLGANDRQATNDVYVAAEELLGEEILNRWIRAIDVTAWKDSPAKPLRIRQLKKEVDGLITRIQGTLPAHPCFQFPDDQEWTGFELKPRKARDYPRQLDLFAGRSMLPAMWVNAHENLSFDSVRFSKHRETFCYIKMDGGRAKKNERFDRKTEIEYAIDSILHRTEVGCVVGAGTGWRYDYVDLAVTDVDRSAKIVKRALRRRNIAKRSWIQFFDSDLLAEWIGVWDDTPPPPMEDFDE